MSKGSPFATLDDLASARGERPAGAKPRGKRPSARVLNAGGTALRVTGALVVVAGFWPFIWAIVELVLLLQVGGESDVNFELERGVIRLRVQGWPSIILVVILAVSMWCGALITIAMGHGLYVLRDVARQMPK